ncbi:MAG: (Fe-S)-binding protein [Gammaproteobacteria bacterium]
MSTQPTAALFVTCLVDLFRPSAGFASAKLLEDAGFDVVVPSAQTCCGQPPYNNGDADSARAIARDVIELLEPYEHVVIPSGSCGGMIKVHYPELFEGDAVWEPRALRLAERCQELTQFLADTCGLTDLPFAVPGKVAYHDSCSARRELDAVDAPRRLMGDKVELKPIADAEVCCGFGGTFCVKYPEVSARMVDDKAHHIAASGADILVSGDMGCLLNIGGRLSRNDCAIRVFHVAELLADMTDGPGMGESVDRVPMQRTQRTD